MTDESSDRAILVVDDNPLNREILKNILLSKGYAVDEAVSGVEALDRVRERGYALILMDLLLPMLDGFETVREMRRMGVTSPIIAQSSLSFKQDRDQAIAAGCNDFIPKPIQLNDLLRMVEKYTSTLDDLPGFPVSAEVGAVNPLLKGCRVLLVEEDAASAKRYVLVLQGAGADVTWVSTGTEAWYLLRDTEAGFRVVVSSIFTSGIDGLGLLSLLKRRDPEATVIIYASEAEHESANLAVKLGADGVLPRSRMEFSLVPVIESAMTRARRTPSQAKDALTASQVRESQRELSKIGIFDVTGYTDKAVRSLHDAGGDLVFGKRLNLAGRYGLMLIDVAGHDVVSSYISAILIGVVTSLVQAIRSPGDLLDIINGELLKLRSDRYQISMSAILWDQRRCSIEIASGGNPGGLVVRRLPEGGLDIRVIEGGGMCLGLFRRNDLFVRDSVTLNEGEYFFTFSDGVETERLVETLTTFPELLDRERLEGLCEDILNRIERTEKADDDMALIVFRAPAPFPETGAHYSLSPVYPQVDAACDWVNGQLSAQGIPAGHDPDFINLAIREALLNAVEHGSQQSPDSRIDLSLYFEHDHLRVDVSDEGSGFDLADKLLEGENLDAFTIGRRGLPLMRAVSDRLEVNGGTVSLIFTERHKEG